MLRIAETTASARSPHQASSRQSPVTVRAYLKNNETRGELARAIAEVAAREHWRIDELHTEEGRLDEVFRNITRPEIKQAEAA